MRASDCALRESVDIIRTRWPKQPSLILVLKSSTSSHSARFFK